MNIQTRPVKKYEPRLGQFFFLDNSDTPVKVIKEIGDGEFIISIGNEKRAVSYKELRADFETPVLPPGQGKGFILPTVHFSTGNVTIPEGSSTQVGLVLSGASDREIRVYCEAAFSLTASDADITVGTSPVVFSPGETTKEITISATSLDGAESEEAFFFSITKVEGASRGGGNTTLLLRVGVSGT